MTDKERIEVYVNELPNSCSKCPLSELKCVDYFTDKYICKLTGGEVKDNNYCPLKTIQSVQNEKSIEQLEKVKDRVKALRDLEISAVRESREFDFKTEDARLEWVKMKTESSKIYNNELKIIDQQINELKGKVENE